MSDDTNRTLVRSLRNRNGKLVCVVIRAEKKEFFFVPLSGPEAMTDIGPYPTVEHAIFNAELVLGEQLIKATYTRYLERVAQKVKATTDIFSLT